MKFKYIILQIVLACIILPRQLLSQQFKEFEPEKRHFSGTFKEFKFDDTFEPLCHIVSPNYCIFVTYILNSTDKDYGRKLFLLKANKATEKIAFVSTGSADSYLMAPHYFRVKGKGDRILILCELATEYSWGFRVFLFENGHIKDIGDLDIAKNIPDDSEPDSALSALKILETQKGIKFEFRGKLSLFPGEKREKNIKRATFIYSGKKIRLL